MVRAWAGGEAAPYPSEMLLLAGGLTWWARAGWGAGRARRWPTAILGAALVWVAGAALVRTGADPAFWSFCRWASLLLTFYGIGRALDRRGAVWFARSVGACLLCLLGVAAWEAAGSTREVPVVGRWVGGSELLAIHVTLLWPLCLGALGAGGGRRDLLAAGGLVAGLSLLALSFSRSGWIGGTLAWAVTLIALGHARRRRGWWVAGMAVIVAAATLGVWVAAGAELPGLPAAYSRRLASLSSSNLLGDRAVEWQRGLSALRAAPWTGQLDAPNCYNLFLQLGARGGWFLLVAMIVWMGAQVTVALAQLRQRPYVAGGLGAVVGLWITGLGESSLGARVVPEAALVFGYLAGEWPNIAERGADNPSVRRGAA